MKPLGEYASKNGIDINFESGQETPVTLLRAFLDIGTGNLFANCDTANLVLYGKSNPVDGLKVLGKYVRSLHEKDGKYPRNPYDLGQEVPIPTGGFDFGHGYTVKLYEGIYTFFQKNLNLPGDPKDEIVTVLDPKELMVTKTGNVASSYENVESVFSINKKETQKLIEKIQASRGKIEPHLVAVQLKANELSGYVAPQAKVKSVLRGRYLREGYSVEMYAINGESNYIITLLLFVPKTGTKFSSVIYINPKGKISDAYVGGRIEQLVKKGYLVAAPDVIGTGETPCSSNVAMIIGRSIVGIQAGDVVRVVNLLKSRKYVDINKIGAIAFNEK